MKMKKIFLALLIIISLSSESFGSSGDVYVRQDVFDAKMEALFTRLDGKIEALGNRLEGKIDALSKELNGKIDSLSKELNGRIDSLSKEVNGRIDSLSARVDGLDKRMDFMSNFLYYILVLLGAMLILPFVNRWLDNKKQKKEAQAKEQNLPFTLDDVRRLIIEEISVRLSAMPQGV